jgi:hypothetical protein
VTHRIAVVDIAPREYLVAHRLIASAWDSRELGGGFQILKLADAFMYATEWIGRKQGQSLKFFWSWHRQIDTSDFAWRPEGDGEAAS